MGRPLGSSACRRAVSGTRIDACGVVETWLNYPEDGIDDRGVVGKTDVVFGGSRLLAGSAAELELDSHQFVEQGRRGATGSHCGQVVFDPRAAGPPWRRARTARPRR